MDNYQVLNQFKQIDLIDRKDEMLLLLFTGMVITGLLAYSNHLQTQKLIAQAYIASGQVNSMYWQKETALESKEIAELKTLHITREFEQYKQQTNAKTQIN